MGIDPVVFGWIFGAGVVWVAMAGAGAYIAVAKGRPPVEGFLFGALLGPLGLLLAALMPGRR